MKIKLYIVTYNNNNALNIALNSLFNSNIENNELQINIINNHSNLSINNKFSSINVMHNIVRPDFSTGHLARDWNCALINGFKSLKNPDCDIVITCQNDIIFAKTWLEQLLVFHEKYCFITACPGDGFCSYKLDTILRVGLWDERFNTIEYQEADYFNRIKLFNKEWSSINDFNHTRLLNPIFSDEHDKSFVFRENTDYDIHEKSVVYYKNNLKLLNSKYDDALNFDNFSNYKNKQPILYPYFEKDILGLDTKYCVLH